MFPIFAFGTEAARLFVEQERIGPGERLRSTLLQRFLSRTIPSDKCSGAFAPFVAHLPFGAEVA